jgi:predicted aldo/keto reductase-like oxidoreductase
VKYKAFGKTGKNLSKLGMGCMRLPMKGNDVIKDEAVAIIQRAIALGVNIFDTGDYYCNHQSESILGEAVKGYDRSKINLSTKYPPQAPTGDDLRERFEESLRKMDQEYIDFYHFWGISWKFYTEELACKNGPLEAALKLKEQGLIKHLSFSFHSDPPELIQLVDTGHFESVLCQYNLLDRSNEAGMAHAARKGLGVAVMGPVGGGRLGGPSGPLQAILGPQKRTATPEIALRFVLANPNVSVAFSGVSSMRQLEENVATASRETYLDDGERVLVEQAIEENKRFADLYCTGCNYCMPCPRNVEIAKIFELVNYHRVYQLTEAAVLGYMEITEGREWIKGKNGSFCIECGECEKKCPQHIKIAQQLKDAHEFLSRKGSASFA